MTSDSQADALRRELDALGAPYELIQCDPQLADTAAFVKHYEYALEDCANTIVIKSKTGEKKFAACVVLATHRLDVNNVVRRKLGARRVSFASAEETQQITNMTPGGVTAIGLPLELALWVDSAVLERRTIVLGGASRSWKIITSPDVFARTPNTQIVAGLAKPMEPKG